MPLVVDPVMVASSGARLLAGRRGRGARRAALPARDGRDAEPARGGGARRRPGHRGASSRSGCIELGAPAAIVTGGHGDDAVDHLFDGERHVEIPVERHDVAATHGAGCTHSATLAALLAQGDARSRQAARRRGGSPRDAVAQRARRDRRGRRARSTSSHLGGAAMSAPAPTLRADPRAEAARPPDHELRRHERDRQRDARARRAAGDGARARGGRGDGRGSPPRSCSTSARSRRTGSRRCCWPAGRRTQRGVPVVLDPVGAGATRYRTETARRILDEVDVTVLRGNAGEVATLVGRRGRGARRRVDRRRRDAAELARAGGAHARARRLRHRPGRPRLRRRARRSRSRTATSCSRRSRARAACRPRSPAASSPPGRTTPLEAAAEALVAFGVAGEDAARGARGARAPSTSPLRRARGARPGDARRRARVAEREAPRARRGPRDRAAAVEGGATVVQLRLKDATDATSSSSGRPRAFASCRRTFVVNDDVEAALGSRPTAFTSAATTREPSARSRPACCSASRPRPSRRRAAAERRARPTSAPGRSGRRRRSRTPIRRSGSTACARSARRSRSRSSRSAASTPRTRATASRGRRGRRGHPRGRRAARAARGVDAAL